jgi:hypothetical protein
VRATFWPFIPLIGFANRTQPKRTRRSEAERTKRALLAEIERAQRILDRSRPADAQADALEGKIAAGWYADPSAPSRWRWWEGNEWTEHIHETAVS